MNKFKHEIIKNTLSWEKNKFLYTCDQINCSEQGKFKAPKSRLKLNEYYFFCLKHVKEYNKSWDFYKGMTVSQIELSMRKDTIWDRPSWPLKGNPDTIIEQLDDLLKNEDNFFKKDRDFNDFIKNKLADESLSNIEFKSLKILGLSMPISVDEIKKKYKKLVKIFHPDVNDNNKDAEKKFKEINEAYKLLLKKFLKKKNE